VLGNLPLDVSVFTAFFSRFSLLLLSSLRFLKIFDVASSIFILDFCFPLLASCSRSHSRTRNPVRAARDAIPRSRFR
jgi:hypothetical protein